MWSGFSPYSWTCKGPQAGLIGINPCGRGVDMLRHPVRVQTNFFNDRYQPVPITWFKCQPGAEMMPFPHAFGSRNWEDIYWQFSPVGENGYLRARNPGSTTTPITATGQGHFCGTEEQWQQGFPFDTFSAVPYNSEDIPTCCGNDNLLWGGGMSDSSAKFSAPGPAMFVGHINTFTPGSNPLTVPAGAPGVIVVVAAGISSVGTLCTVTSANVGVLTPVLSEPGPAGMTYSFSTVAIFWYAWDGSADVVTLGGIPAGGVAIASVVTFPGAAGALVTSAGAVGAAEPMSLPLGGSSPGAALLIGQLYSWFGGAQGWVLPFLVAHLGGAPDTAVNYDGVNYALDTGYFLTPTGAPATGQDSASGSVWAAVGGAWT